MAMDYLLSTLFEFKLTTDSDGDDPWTGYELVEKLTKYIEPDAGTVMVSHGRISLSDGNAATVPLQGITTTRLVCLFGDDDFTAAAGTESWLVAAPDATITARLFVASMQITALTVTRTNASTTDVGYLLVGV